jgi:CDP-diacylglycerol--glycerol-3-phosphate 3-phosphatidyltransferase
MLNLPTIITFSRFAMVALIIIFYATESYTKFIFPLFLLAGFTDWLDGYLARLLQQQTAFGAFFDQVADKVVVTSSLIILIDWYQTRWITLPTIFIINRELLMSALRYLAMEQGVSKVIAVNGWGKAKTALQFVAISFLLAFPVWLHYSSIFYLGLTALIGSALLAWSSFIHYALALYPHLEFQKK